MTPQYARSLDEGLAFQDFVTHHLYRLGIPLVTFSSKSMQLLGENMAGVEIRKDNRWRTTGNLYIETAEKSNANNARYVPSGIYRPDNSWLYLIGDESRLFILSKKQLQVVHKWKKFHEVTTATSRGFLVPVEYAEQFLAVRIIDIDPETE